MSEISTFTSANQDQEVISGKHLTFYIGDSLYGVSLVNVIEIIGVQAFTVVPGLPHYIKGITNLRGKIVPVVDVRLKMNVEPVEYDERTCVIVITWNESLVGLIVDRVAEVGTFGEEDLSALPEFSSMNTNKYLSSVCRSGDNLVLILDCDTFLND